MYRQVHRVFSPLLEMLTDHHESQYDKVACMALQVVAILSSSQASKEMDSSATSPDTPVKGGKGDRGKASKQDTHVVVKPQPMLNEYFHKFMVEILKMFDSDKALLENKGSFLIRYETRNFCGYVIFAHNDSIQ